jgi:hypothetical protein
MSFTARDLGLTVVDPTSIEEPDEPDEIERELQASKKRNAELESRIPRLKLTFEDGKEHMKMRAPAFEPGGEEALAALRREKLLVHSPPASFYSRADRGELLRYTEEHRDYMADVALYFDDAEAWRAREARTVVLSPRLENVGRVPAESSSVEMLFPEGIEVETEESRPRRPLEPRAPELPVDYGGLIIISPSRFRPKYERGFRPSKAETASDHLGGGLTGLWLPKIKRLPDGRTFFGENFQKVQQATSEVVGPLYLVMPERIESFNIEFLLKADHMEQVRGQLHVVVERDE